MGSFSDIHIDSYSGFSNKNGFYHDVVELIFTSSDYKEVETKDEEGDIYIEKYFVSKVSQCLDRLKIYGTTLNKAKSEYEKFQNESEYFEISMTYDKYVNFINSCIYSGKGQYELEKIYSDIEQKLIEYDFQIGQSTSSWLYSILQSLKPDTVIKYDLTFVINNGWVQEGFIDDLDFRKIIILTEGKTDTKFIKTSIKLLYPHLENNYHFMDFGELSLNGSASYLVHNVKSFIGSGINNKIIALFDNDTAGLKEMNLLNKLTIPNNIRVLSYPDIQLADNYPTLGPTGEQKMNINGLACSIEMYLGQELLIEENDLYMPIQWKGFETSMNAYQGEVLNKKLIQKRFESKLKSLNDNEIIRANWEEMYQLLNLIKTAWD
jgi:hypothetical protein